MNIILLVKAKKSRRYPVQLDREGRSLRARCFELFEDGMRPVEVAKELDMKESTAHKYFQQWKQFGPNFEQRYTYFKSLLSNSAPDRDNTLELSAKACGISKGELEAILAQPHGLKRMMTQKFYWPAQKEADRKRQIALKVALCISDHLINDGGAVEDVLFAFKHLLDQSKKNRNEEDADIEEENKEIAFTRNVLEAAAEAERQGRSKRDRLTIEERNAIIKYGLEAKKRLLEKQYWVRIAELMGEGLSHEQAREKIYQDLVDKGDLKGTKMMRAYQNTIHPVKEDDQVPPISPPQPPSPA